MVNGAVTIFFFQDPVPAYPHDGMRASRRFGRREWELGWGEEKDDAHGPVFASRLMTMPRCNGREKPAGGK